MRSNAAPACRRPTIPLNPVYVLMWRFNTGRKQLPAAPEQSFYAAGGGGNYLWVDPEHDPVVVVRWVPDLNGVVERVLAALEPVARRGP